MKLNMKALALMGALAAGVASAAADVPNRTDAGATNAGTKIVNTANASFTNPADPNGPKTNVPSNDVTTIVQAKQFFNITYVGGGDVDATDFAADAATPTTRNPAIPDTYVKDIPAGKTAVFEYVALNNGNGEQTITLDTDVQGVDKSTVHYYLPLNGGSPFNDDGSPKTGATEITSTGFIIKPQGDDPTTTDIVETNTGVQHFYMSYTVPSVTTTGTVVGATPIGTGLIWTGTDNQRLPEQKNAGTPTYDDLFWQYNAVKVQLPGALVGPNNDPTATNTTDTPPYTPTGGNNQVYPGGTTGPDGSTKVPDDQQQTVAPACTTTTGKTVRFTNTVRNTGSVDDILNLTTTVPTGATVKLYAADGTALLTDHNNDQIVDTGTLTAGADFSFIVEVTTASCVTANVSVEVTAKTTVDTQNPKSDTTTDVIVPPAKGLVWGDGDKNDTTAPNNPGNTGNGTDTTPVAGYPGDTVKWNMEVQNTGPAATTYTPSGSVVFEDKNGVALPPVNIVYKFDSDCDGTPDGGTNGGASGVVDPGKIGCFVATVTIPANAAPGTTPAFTQTVKDADGTTATDTNDTIKVLNPAGNITVGKFVKGGTGDSNGITAPTGYGATGSQAYPGDTLDYIIIAKSTYPVGVKSFALTDNVPANTTFVSASCNVPSVTTCKVLYSTTKTDNTPVWMATVPADLTTVKAIALDVNGDGAITADDVLPANGTAQLNMSVKIN